MTKTNLPKAGTILACKQHGYLTGVAGLTGHKTYTLLKDCVQEVWYYGPHNDLPFYPEIKACVVNDNGVEISCSLSRFTWDKQKGLCYVEG